MFTKETSDRREKELASARSLLASWQSSSVQKRKKKKKKPIMQGRPGPDDKSIDTATERERDVRGRSS